MTCSLAISALFALLSTTQPTTIPATQPVAMTKEEVTSVLASPAPEVTLREAVKSNFKNGWAIFGLAYVAHKNGHTSEAAGYYSRADKLIDHSPEYVFDCAANDTNIGLSRRAVGNLVRLIQQHPELPERYTDLLGHARAKDDSSGAIEAQADRMLVDRCATPNAAGARKWGASWLDAPAWAALQRQLKDTNYALELATNKDKDALADLERVRAVLRDAPLKQRGDARDEVLKASRREQQTADAMEKARKAVPVPVWPATFQPIW